MRSGRRAAVLITVAPMVAALAGCGGGAGANAPPRGATTAASSPTAGAANPAAATNWLTYHGNAARTGAVAGLPAASRLAVAWSAHLDGAVYGQPLVIGQVVVAATEDDSVYGLNRGSGRVLWRSHLGVPVPLAAQPCGDIDPLGITGTPVYDRVSGLVYVVAQTAGSRHVLFGIKVATGQVRLTRDIPAPDRQPAYDQQRGALTLEDGRVYAAFGGHYGDCGPYVGSVVAVPASGSGPILSYRVPTARQGGIWAPGGPVIGPDRTIYVSSGNGEASRPPFDGSDSVIALSPDLRRLEVFAPSRWAQDNADDLDLGSTSPALLPDGRILQVGKGGIGYLLDASRLGGVGGELGSAPVCPAFGGAAVSGTTVYVPCYRGGMAAVTTSGDQIRVLWRGPAAASGSPVVGGGAVWVADGNSGILYQLSPQTGQVRYQIGLGATLPHFASPTLSGTLVLIGSTSGVVAVAGA